MRLIHDTTLSPERALARLEELIAVGRSLSKERDTNRLLEDILLAAKKIANADGGTLYRVEDGRLKFEIIRNDTLSIAMGGTTGVMIPFDPIPMMNDRGEPNNAAVSAYSAIHDVTINIEDAYEAEGFDFSGTKKFDAKTGYRSKSFLTIPMKNHEDEIIGVLQLINARDPATGEIQAFGASDQYFVEALASQAAIALTNRLLIIQLENLFESFINLINAAIDEKSPYTGGHCARVPVLTMMLAEAVNQTHPEGLGEFRMSDRDRYELKIAGLLHDCGKITTPVHVVDKATKLQTIYDRIGLLDTRYEVLKRDAHIECLQKKLAALDADDAEAAGAAEAEYQARLQKYDDDREFLRRANIGGEFMAPALQERVRGIASHPWTGPDGQVQNFLSDEEVYNLNIARGTLTTEEREIINHHITVTIKMLESLPWPRHLKNVPEYAGGHHEKMDGTGYPRKLKREQMSVQARVMGIADIFEALTAKDRPYKPGKTLSESLTILGRMRLDNHIDPDLFDVFIREKVYLKYAQLFLEQEQIDQVDDTKIPGYQP